MWKLWSLSETIRMPTWKWLIAEDGGISCGEISAHNGNLQAGVGGSVRRQARTRSILYYESCIHWFWRSKEDFCCTPPARFAMGRHFYLWECPEPVKQQFHRWHRRMWRSSLTRSPTYARKTNNTLPSARRSRAN